MKIDFRKIMIHDVEGNEVPTDISKPLGNMMYMQGHNIEECELGRVIYHKGEVELNEQQAKHVERFLPAFSFIIRQAVTDLLNPRRDDADTQ